MISVGFSTTNMVVSRIIRWATKAKCSHTFIIFDWLGEKWILEAGFTGVAPMRYDKFKKSNTIVAEVDLPGLVIDDIKSALDEMGDNYDFGGLFGGFWPLIGTWFKMKWNNPWNNTKAMFCSELVATWLKQLKWKGCAWLTPADVTPQQLLNILSP